MLSIDFLKKAYPYRGDFVVFEGYNGVGKTTLAKELTEKLKDKAIPSFYTHEPTKDIDEITGKIIALDDGSLSDEDIDLNAYLLDRFKHLSNIICPLIRGGVNVVCDRYDWSTLVDQDINTKERENLYLDVMNMISRNTWIQPDLYVYCYAQPKLIQQRLLARDSTDVPLETIRKYCDRYDRIVNFFYSRYPEKTIIFEVEGKMTLNDQIKELYSAVSNKLDWG